MSDTPADILHEVLGGIYDGIQPNIESTDEMAYIFIEGPDHTNWTVTVRKTPTVETEKKVQHADHG